MPFRPYAPPSVAHARATLDRIGGALERRNGALDRFTAREAQVHHAPCEAFVGLDRFRFRFSIPAIRCPQVEIEAAGELDRRSCPAGEDVVIRPSTFTVRSVAGRHVEKFAVMRTTTPIRW